MPDYKGDFDTRIEEMETEQLLRRVKFHLENPDAPVARQGAAPSAGSADFDNLHLGNEMYFQLDYAAKIYDPRSVPANTRFRRIKNLLMRVMRLYATRQVEFNATVVKLLNMIQDRFEEVVGRFNYFRAAEVRTQEALRVADGRLEKLEQRALAFEDFQRSQTVLLEKIVSRLVCTENDIKALVKSCEAAGQRIDGAEAGIKNLAERTLSAETGIKNLAQTAEGAAERLQAIEKGFVELGGLVDDLQLRNAAVQGVFGELKAKLESGALSVTAGENAASGSQTALLDNFEKAWNSADYELFEDESRGGQEEIRERLSFYLPFLKAASEKGGLAADLGCGRGELLQLMKEAGIASCGVDSNRAAVERGRAQGLDMQCQDLFSYLEGVPGESLCAVTAMHVIEHLNYEEQGRLLSLALKALKPGGFLAFETPNLMNLHVAACDFYSDATHIRPVHPVALRNRMKQMGYKDIDIMFLHPFPKGEGLGMAGLEGALKENFEKLNDLIWGCRDCVILATKKEKL